MQNITKLSVWRQQQQQQHQEMAIKIGNEHLNLFVNRYHFYGEVERGQRTIISMSVDVSVRV